MTTRRMTPARRLRIWTAANGLCGSCGEPVALAEADIDHENPLWISSRDDDLNLRPLHFACHKKKTAIDLTVIAKIKRIIAREDGTRRPRKAIQSRGFSNQKRAWPKRKT